MISVMFERLFYAASGGFIGGVAIASFITVPLLYIGVGACVSALLCFLFRFFEWPGARFYMVAAASVLTICFGMVWMYARAVPTDPWLLLHEGARVGFVGTVIREPDERSSHTMLFVSDIVAGIEGTGAAVSGTVLLRVPTYPKWSYGDRISVSGIVTPPTSFETDAGRVFDYPSYLKRFGVTHTVDRPRVSLVASGYGNPIVSLLFAFKERLMGALALVIPSPSVELLFGILFGSQRGLPADLEDFFRRAGLIHIVVLSGYNLSVIADWIMRAASRLPRSIGLLLGALSIVAYATMAGASATAVRAALMALLVVMAQVVRRRYNVSRALTLAGVSMVILNPHVLLFDRSFQLSFIATIAVIYVAPLVESRVSWVSERFALRSIVASTIATNILVLPLLLYTAGSVSLLSLPANILALPLIPATMLLGVITAGVALIAPHVALLSGLITHAFLVWVMRVAQWCGGEWSLFTMPPFSPVWMIGAYLLLGAGIVYVHRKRRDHAHEDVAPVSSV